LKLQEVVTTLEMIEIDRFLGSHQFSAIGRQYKDRTTIARAFVAKAVLNFSTTEALIERLKMDLSLRRICGFSNNHPVPLPNSPKRLPERVHAALIAEHLGDQLICHIRRDSTAIISRERPRYKPARPVSTLPQSHQKT
jgi:hypothetical protein